jgi:glycosyltransferase involved in cell wall biosynthesis
MKVLVSCLSQSWGGMEMFTLTLVKQLLKRNIEVQLLAHPESRLFMEAHNLGLILHSISATGYFHPIKILKFSSIIKQDNIDLIHTSDSKDLWLIVPALKLAKSNIPLVLTKHVGSFVKKKDFLHKSLYKRVDSIFAISQVIKQNLIDTCPIDGSLIEMMPSGIDTARFAQEQCDSRKIRAEFSVADNEILIGMVGRFSPGKGHEEFISAAEILNQKQSNLKFLIVGEASRGEDDYEQEIRRQVENRDLNNVIFSGFRNDIPDVLAALDIFLFPSHSEAFGMALVEAMAAGKPAVAAGSDGVLDIMLDGITGFLFEKKNSKDLADKTNLLIKSPELRTSLGNKARERAIEHFDLSAIIDRHIRLYSQIIQRKEAT